VVFFQSARSVDGRTGRQVSRDTFLVTRPAASHSVRLAAVSGRFVVVSSGLGWGRRALGLWAGIERRFGVDGTIGREEFGGLAFDVDRLWTGALGEPGFDEPTGVGLEPALGGLVGIV
jgi:hypothetical protein